MVRFLVLKMSIMKTIRIVFLPATAYHISGNCIIFTNEVANAVLCCNLPQNRTILLKEHSKSWDMEYHIGNYIYALQEKEKYHKTCKVMKGKAGRAAKENNKNRKRDENVKRKKIMTSPFGYGVMILVLMWNIFHCFLVIFPTSSIQGKFT